MGTAGRYELGEDGIWLDLSRPTNFEKDEESMTFASAEDYEVMEYMSTLESQLAERDRAAKGDADLIVLLRKQVDWHKLHMWFELEPDWSEVMRKHHALTPEQDLEGESSE